MRQVALDVHLALLALCRRRERDDPEDARAHPFGDPFDDPALAGTVATLEHDADLEPLEDDPVLEPDQLGLQARQFLLVLLALHPGDDLPPPRRPRTYQASPTAPPPRHAPISPQTHPGTLSESADCESAVAAAAPAAAPAAAGAARLDGVVVVVVTVSAWTTVTVCAGAVTVVGGAVTVWAGAVTVVVGPGTVVVTVVWGVETVVGLDAAPATVCEGGVSVRAGRVTGEVEAGLEEGAVTPSVLVPVRLPATLPAPPEPQPARPLQEPRTTSASAVAAPRRTRSASPHRVMPGATSRSEALVRPRPASSRRRRAWGVSHARPRHPGLRSLRPWAAAHPRRSQRGRAHTEGSSLPPDRGGDGIGRPCPRA